MVFIIVILSFFLVRCDERKNKLQDMLTRLVNFHENMISALTWLTSAESKIAELDSAVDAATAEEHPDVSSLKSDLKVIRRSMLCNGHKTCAPPVTYQIHCFYLDIDSPCSSLPPTFFSSLCPSVSFIHPQDFIRAGSPETARRKLTCLQNH